jgi:malate synthase
VTEQDLLETQRNNYRRRVRKNQHIRFIPCFSTAKVQQLYNLMEDAATAEISRSQLWQWLQNKVILDNGKILNESYYHRLAMEEFEKIKNLVGDENHEKQKYRLAEQLLDELVVNDTFINF